MSRFRRLVTPVAVLTMVAAAAPAARAQSAVAAERSADSVAALALRPAAVAAAPATAAAVTLAPAAVTRAAVGESSAETALRQARARELGTAVAMQGGRNPGQGKTYMIIGGVAFLAGAIIGDDAGTIIMIGGAALGIYGLYLYL